MSNLRQADHPAIKVRSFGVTFQSGESVLPFSLPRSYLGSWHQLIYATRGVMTVRTAQCAWVVPPHRAALIPAGTEYRVELSGVVAVRNLYLRAQQRSRRLPSALGLAPAECTVVNVTPLLRELIVRINGLGALDARIPKQRRLMEVLFDELNTLTAAPLQLPMPGDARAAKFVELANTQIDRTMAIDEMLRHCGASRRTMERLLLAETAMSLGQWLRRQRLLHALRRLAAGDAVNSVALDLGYNSASAFIAMFRRELGQTPKRYFTS